MPVDPEISLQVRGGASGPANAGYAPAGAPSNPLAAVESMVGIQRGMNELKQFQQTFAARKRAGEILATAPDLDTGVSNLLKDPLVSGFAPELAQSAASTRQTIIAAQGEGQRQGFEAFQHTLSNLPQAIPGLAKGDFTGWDAMVKNGLNMASPSARPGMVKSFENMKSWLTHDLSSDPKEAQEQITQRLVAGLTTAAPGAIPTLFGTPTSEDIGSKKVLGVGFGPGNALGAPSGSFAQAGQKPVNELTKDIAPQLAPPTALPYKDRNAGPAGATAPAPSAPPDSQLAGNGELLFPKDWDADANKPKVKNLGGGPANPQEAAEAEDLMKAHTTTEREAARGAQNLQSQLAELDNALTTAAKHGGLTTPGTAADFRTGIARLITTVADATGDKDLADLKLREGAAAAEDAMKVTQRMGIAYLPSVLGQQREAAETISNITNKGMPGLSNTLLGSKLMATMIGSIAQRTTDQYNFNTTWAAKHDGNLINAEAAFNKQKPAKSYIDSALQKLGMNENGFSSPAAAKAALDRGLLTPEQYRAILQNKGKLPADLPKAE